MITPATSLSTCFFALAVLVGAMWLAAVAADVDNRYRRLEDHADAGLGTDEFEGPRRYSRPTDRGPISNPTLQQQKVPVHSAKNATGTSDQITHKENQS